MLRRRQQHWLDQPTRALPIVSPLMTPAAQWRSGGGRLGRLAGLGSGRDLEMTVRLEIEPGQWWNGPREGRLIVDVRRVEPRVDVAGTVTWAVVEGRRIMPDGRRIRTRELVRAAALPAELLDG